MSRWQALVAAWRCRAQLAGDRGALALELAIIAPVVFLLIFGIIQGGLYFHAREVAHRAAEQGMERGRAFDAQPGDGTAAARSFLDRMGGSVEAAQVSDDGSTNQQVRISVTGTVATLVPGIDLHVAARSQGPVERLNP